MCPVFCCAGTALPDAWESADRRRRERHFLCGGAGGGFAGLLTAKGEPVSVGSEPCFPLERAYACPAGRVRGHGAKRCLPCGGAGGELAGSPTAKDCRCRWAVSRASPWSVRMCVRQAGGGRLRRETALPMLRGRQWGTDQRAVSGSTGLSRHSAPAKGIKTAPAVWGQTLFGFRLCLGIYRGLGVLIDGLPGHGVKIRAGGLIRCRSLGQLRGGS